VLLLGVTYKPNIADVRESPAAPLAKCLIAAGAKVRFHDPHVKNWAVAGQDLTSESDLYAAVAEADVCVLLQNHNDYDVDELAICSRQFLDTRGVTRRAATVERL
jgi:UDP-N-acetyl-D-mannosaminuronate dehydrogenase